MVNGRMAGCSKPRGADDQVGQSLRAAEKARNASESFIQKVNLLVPQDSKKYHRDLLKGIDSKLALLKKNVAYLVIQNLNLIDKLMDAENTVHQVRNLHELRNMHDRPNTFAAPDTPTKHDSSDRAKCESWCNPSLDFMFFNDNNIDLQSHKLSLTDTFMNHKLRQYIIREDMVDHLQPHLAAYLYPNHFADKDSDNDSGTGEEIASPDETPYFESSKFPADASDPVIKAPRFTDHQFASSKFAAEFETLGGNLEAVSSVIANGNFSVKCSSGIIAQKFGEQIRISTDIGFVQSINNGEMGQPEEPTSTREIGDNVIGNSDTSLQPTAGPQNYDNNQRRGCGIMPADHHGNEGDINVKQDVYQTKTFSRIDSNANIESITQVRRTSIRNNGYGVLKGSNEPNALKDKNDKGLFERYTQMNRSDTIEQTIHTNKKNIHAKVNAFQKQSSDVCDSFAKDLIETYSTKKKEFNNDKVNVPDNKIDKNETKSISEKAAELCGRKNDESSLYKNENKQNANPHEPKLIKRKQIGSDSINANETKQNNEGSTIVPKVSNVRQQITGNVMKQKQNPYERANTLGTTQHKEKQTDALQKSESLNIEPGLSFIPSSLANTPTVSKYSQPVVKSNRPVLQRSSSTLSAYDDDDYENITAVGDNSNMRRRSSSQFGSNLELSDRQRNFSSKVNRGNKLRKSKRIEETQKMFQLKKNDVEAEGKKQQDPALRRLESISRVSGTASSAVKLSEKVLKRLQNSQGDLCGP